MGEPLATLRSSARLQLEHPIYPAVGSVFVFAAHLAAMVVGFVPLVGWYIAIVLVFSLLNTGLIGMTDAASDGGDTSTDVFFETVRNKYTTVAGSYAITAALTAVVGSAWLLSSSFITESGGGPRGLLPTGLALVVGLGFVLTIVALQFVGVAAVVDDCGSFEAVTESATLLVTDPVSVLGYSVVRAVLLFGPAALFAASFLLALQSVALTPGSVPSGAAILSLGVAVLAGYLLLWLWYILLHPLLLSYHVEFYRRVTDGA